MEISVITPGEGLPSPGKCKLCGSVQKNSYVHTGYYEDRYGAVLYCEECVIYIASFVGCLGPNQRDKIVEEARKHYVEKMDLLEKVVNLEGAINGMVAAGFSPSDNSVSELDMAVLQQEPDTRQPGTEDELGEGEGEITEQNDDEGMAELRSDELISKSFKFNL